jgi:hypothetical protein
MTMTVTISTTSSTLAPVVCTTWCVDGSGHVDADEPHEQFCRSARHSVELAETPDGTGGSWQSRVYVHLYRDAGDGDGSDTADLQPPRVELVGTGSDTMSLSTQEARELGELLLQLAAAGDGSGG